MNPIESNLTEKILKEEFDFLGSKEYYAITRNVLCANGFCRYSPNGISSASIGDRIDNLIWLKLSEDNFT